ncbi:MAG: crossover junction endodeoxyribonuclease RuvC [Clostridia bacterium]|nr:crossover junction endodeoxyribonuclease RuvC [Clostridia bacterium]
MIILGIDPGIAIVGWGVLRYENGRFTPLAYGSVQTKAGLKVEDRLKMVYDGVSEIINKYHPDVMSIEELFWNTNQKTGIVVAEARGVILLSAREAGIPIFEYTPLQVKQAIVGYGRAEKRQVIMMVTTFLGLKEPPKPDDTADAIALAICHGHNAGSKIAQLYNR